MSRISRFIDNKTTQKMSNFENDEGNSNLTPMAGCSNQNFTAELP